MRNMSSKWIGKLGTPNEFRGVPYVTASSTGEVCCELCCTGWMNRSQRKAHFNGSRHATNYNSVKRLEEEERRERRRLEDISLSVTRMMLLEPRVEQLGLEKWRDAVKSAMYDFTRNAGPDALYDNVERLISKYERMEVASLLELALWKYAVLNGEMFSSLVEVREYPVLDETFDVEAYLREARICGGSDSIVPRVLAFL